MSAAVGNGALTAELDTSYRAFMSRFPTGVAVVTTLGDDGRPYGLTCSSLTSVTLRPPTLLVCIDCRSGTLTALRRCGTFGVNLLHARGRRAAEVFAAPLTDRFAAIAWRPAGDLGMPWLVDDAAGFAECTARDLTPVGDHVVVFGTVRSVLSGTGYDPLLYGLRHYRSWAATYPGESEEVR